MKTVSESKESEPAGEQRKAFREFRKKKKEVSGGMVDAQRPWPEDYGYHDDGEFNPGLGFSDSEKEEAISDCKTGNFELQVKLEDAVMLIPVAIQRVNSYGKKTEEEEEEEEEEGDEWLTMDCREILEWRREKMKKFHAIRMKPWLEARAKRMEEWRAQRIQLGLKEEEEEEEEEEKNNLKLKEVYNLYSSCLVYIERDYVSMDMRYPRLYVPRECSKVVVNWPRENLKIPFDTPVSFEHDFIEEETTSEHKIASITVMTDDPAKPERASTLWNAKMILMSGLSQNDLEELSSERSYEYHIPHLCNMLRFAILKKENSSMAIGGPWDSIDGADPSVDNSSLVQTALRYANGVTQLDLKNCQHWNPFLEIHYDRLGKDGLFSHKEITVLYVPDLSECLPSVDAWRDQWLANKKAIAEPKSRDMKEKKTHEEPPRYPGLFLQTKGSKDSELCSLSLSLESLLDYTDTDIEESTFEISLFAETFYEMLQYQMGSRLLTFLQKLRIKFVSKRNQRKRKWEESLMTESEKASSSKSVKTEESTVENKIVNTETPDEDRLDDENAVVKKENVKEQKLHTHAKYISVAEKKKDPQDENAMETSETKPKLEGKDGKGEKAKAKMERKKKVTPVIVDKELLQAFRFFDRDRVGYIRIEDMMLIIQNLGKFMSQRDVEELVESALMESNTGGMNDRILYNKLVRMTDISET